MQLYRMPFSVRAVEAYKENFKLMRRNRLDMVERSDTVEISTSANATCQGLQLNTTNMSPMIFSNFTGSKMNWSEEREDYSHR